MHIVSNNPYLSSDNWECVQIWCNQSHALMPCQNQRLCTAATKAFDKAAIACTSTDVGGSDTIRGILSWLTQHLHKANKSVCAHLKLQGCTGVHNYDESVTWYARMRGVVVQANVHKWKSMQIYLLWRRGQDASLLAACTIDGDLCRLPADSDEDQESAQSARRLHLRCNTAFVQTWKANSTQLLGLSRVG